MKVLWVLGRLIGPAASIVSSDYTGTSGSWIQTEYDGLDKTNIEMFYLAGVKGSVNHITAAPEGTVYCIQLPQISSGFPAPEKMVVDVKRILDMVNPDIIHIWGTETCLQDAVVRASDGIPKVVFIQGLIGMHDRYRGGYMNISDKDYVGSIHLAKRVEQYVRRIAFRKQIKIEKNILRTSENVILDNDYSRAYCFFVCQDINFYYRHLNANACFGNVEWKYEDVKKHSVFTVYGGSPDKGLHQLLKAIQLVKSIYPDILLRVPGQFSLGQHGECINRESSSYEKWIGRYIQKNGLMNNVDFVGPKSQEEMAELLAGVHIFVNPSCMEVHALSLREAMTVGVPSISSLCGSVIEYIKPGENGIIYRYEEYEVLAYKIISLFENDRLACKMGKCARNEMMKALEHQNSLSLNEIYKDIIDKYEN